MAKKVQRRQAARPNKTEARTPTGQKSDYKKPQQALKRDVKAALKDKTVSKKEGKQLRANYGMGASQKLAQKLVKGEGKYELSSKAGEQLGLKYRDGRNFVTFDPRAFGKSQTYYQTVGSLGSLGAMGLQEEQTRWKYPQNAPGKGWYVKGYKKGKDGSQIPIYGYGAPGGGGGKNKNKGKKEKGGGAEGGGPAPSTPWEREVTESLDPLEDQIWQQAQDSLNQIDYFDKMLDDMLKGMGDLSGTGPGIGYTVGVTTPTGSMNTYYTDPLGRPLPQASTLSVPLA